VRITPAISIDDAEVSIEFVRSSGPGGQNVNKVSTAAQLRFNAMASPSLSDEVKRRLASIAGSRMTAAGEIIIDARRHRSQKLNRDDALSRLAELIRRAAIRPRPRRATSPTAASRRRRLDAKRQHSQTKSLRRGPADEN
jgi:ribosome-associated protein